MSYFIPFAGALLCLDFLAYGRDCVAAMLFRGVLALIGKF